MSGSQDDSNVVTAVGCIILCTPTHKGRIFYTSCGAVYIYTDCSLLFLIDTLHMKAAVLCAVLHLWSLVEVHSQTAPYVSFMGEILPNYAYVDLSLVGNDFSGSDSVQCHTDLVTCCSGGQGVHRGDWIPPGSEERLPFSHADIYESRRDQRVDLRHWNNADITSGIYRCDIPTNAVHNVDNTSVRDSVYIVLYTSRGRYINTCIKIIRLFWDGQSNSISGSGYS